MKVIGLTVFTNLYKTLSEANFTSDKFEIFIDSSKIEDINLLNFLY
jgi:hypothetical protein